MVDDRDSIASSSSVYLRAGGESYAGVERLGEEGSGGRGVSREAGERRNERRAARGPRLSGGRRMPGVDGERVARMVARGSENAVPDGKFLRFPKRRLRGRERFVCASAPSAGSPAVARTGRIVAETARREKRYFSFCRIPTGGAAQEKARRPSGPGKTVPTFLETEGTRETRKPGGARRRSAPPALAERRLAARNAAGKGRGALATRAAGRFDDGETGRSAAADANGAAKRNRRETSLRLIVWIP